MEEEEDEDEDEEEEEEEEEVDDDDDEGEERLLMGAELLWTVIEQLLLFEKVFKFTVIEGLFRLGLPTFGFGISSSRSRFLAFFNSSSITLNRISLAWTFGSSWFGWEESRGSKNRCMIKCE